MTSVPAGGSALVGATALRAELESAAADAVPLLLDVRWTLAGPHHDEYLSGHLPGAVFCDLEADLSAPAGVRGRHPLPSAEAMTATMRRLGVAPARPVVVYDGGPSLAASRAWWCLRWAGHDDTRLLDGGLPAWVEAGGVLERGDVTPVPAPDAAARVGAMPVATLDEVASGEVGVLVDVRTPERFRGEVEPVDPVAGHIPGAVSCPGGALFGPDGRLRPPAELRAVLAPLLSDPAAGTRGVTSYCGSGVTATQLVLALHEVGVTGRLYPGSWSEWVAGSARPVATGP
ncbi:MAG: sulfurtransferase [Actinomycetes bacterium]